MRIMALAFDRRCYFLPVAVIAAVVVFVLSLLVPGAFGADIVKEIIAPADSSSVMGGKVITAEADVPGTFGITGYPTPIPPDRVCPTCGRPLAFDDAGYYDKYGKMVSEAYTPLPPPLLPPIKVAEKVDRDELPVPPTNVCPTCRRPYVLDDFDYDRYDKLDGPYIVASTEPILHL